MHTPNQRRKHGSNQLGSACKSSYFCNSSVILSRIAAQGRDASSGDRSRPRYFDDYVPGTTYDCGSVSVSQDEILSSLCSSTPRPSTLIPARRLAAVRRPGRLWLAWGDPW
jgi:hypothetical protein